MAQLRMVFIAALTLLGKKKIFFIFPVVPVPLQHKQTSLSCWRIRNQQKGKQLINHVHSLLHSGFSTSCTAAAAVSKAGGAGHALQFRDHSVVIENFNSLAPNELTFEAWLRTSDSCHRSAIFSYARRVEDPAADETARTIAANHFVIFDQGYLVACHDFEYMYVLTIER